MLRLVFPDSITSTTSSRFPSFVPRTTRSLNFTQVWLCMLMPRSVFGFWHSDRKQLSKMRVSYDKYYFGGWCSSFYQWFDVAIEAYVPALYCTQCDAHSLLMRIAVCRRSVARDLHPPNKHLYYLGLRQHHCLMARNLNSIIPLFCTTYSPWSSHTYVSIRLFYAGNLKLSKTRFISFARAPQNRLTTFLLIQRVRWNSE